MTTRHSGYHVVLTDDIREDDAEFVINAIRMVRGVAQVTPVEASYEDVMARGRRDDVWREKLRALLDEMRS
jgi:hypothetical protein